MEKIYKKIWLIEKLSLYLCIIKNLKDMKDFERILRDSQFNHYKGRSPKNEYQHNRLSIIAIIGKNNVVLTKFTPNYQRFIGSISFDNPIGLVEYLDKNQIY